jgi:hypothetical protein
MLQRHTVSHPHNPLAHAHSWLTPHEAVSRACRTAQSLYHTAGSPATQDNRESSLHHRRPALHQQPQGRFVSIDSLYCRADSTTSPCARTMLATPSTSHRDAVVPTHHARTLVVDGAIAASSMRHATHASLHRHQHRRARPSHLRHGGTQRRRRGGMVPVITQHRNADSDSRVTNSTNSPCVQNTNLQLRATRLLVTCYTAHTTRTTTSDFLDSRQAEADADADADADAEGEAEAEADG